MASSPRENPILNAALTLATLLRRARGALVVTVPSFRLVYTDEAGTVIFDVEPFGAKVAYDPRLVRIEPTNPGEANDGTEPKP